MDECTYHHLGPFFIKIPLTEMNVLFGRTTTEQLTHRSQSVCVQVNRYVLRAIPPMMCKVMVRNLLNS